MDNILFGVFIITTVIQCNIKSAKYLVKKRGLGKLEALIDCVEFYHIGFILFAIYLILQEV